MGCSSSRTVGDETKVSKPREEEIDSEKEKEVVNYKTKYEKILDILHNLKKGERSGKKIEEMNWVIDALQNGDIYGAENAESSERELVQEFDFLAEYSGKNQRKELLETLSKIAKNKKASYNGFITKLKSKIGNIIVKEETNKLTLDMDPEVLKSLEGELNKIYTFDFNVFAIDKIIEKKTLLFVSNQILTKYSFLPNIIPEDKFRNFILEITEGYNRSVPYHNDLHATDVLQTTNLFIEEGGLILKLKLNSLDVMSTLIAAMCHDYKHNGFNNSYHMNLGSDIAINYNDVSVLENYHISESFKTILKPDNNIFEALKADEYKIVRKRIIEGILSTDMASHAKQLLSFRSKLDSLQIDQGENVEKLVGDNLTKNFENQQSVLSMCIHSADLSNPAKPAEVYEKWTSLIFIEFFNQGDLEKSKGLPVSMLCDRETTKIAKSQIGFINFIVLPTLDLMRMIVPKCQPYLDTLEANLKINEKKSKEE